MQTRRYLLRSGIAHMYADPSVYNSAYANDIMPSPLLNFQFFSFLHAAENRGNVTSMSLCPCCCVVAPCSASFQTPVDVVLVHVCALFIPLSGFFPVYLHAILPTSLALSHLLLWQGLSPQTLSASPTSAAELFFVKKSLSKSTDA